MMCILIVEVGFIYIYVVKERVGYEKLRKKISNLYNWMKIWVYEEKQKSNLYRGMKLWVIEKKASILYKGTKMWYFMGKTCILYKSIKHKITRKQKYNHSSNVQKKKCKGKQLQQKYYFHKLVISLLQFCHTFVRNAIFSNLTAL